MQFLLIFALALSFAPPTQQNAQERSRQSRDSQPAKNSISPATLTKPIPQPHQSEPEHLHWNSEVKVTDALIVAFTLGLVIVGGLQWRALNHTIGEASKASARQSKDMLASIAVAHDAAKAATENAASAKVSASAYMTSERAWLSMIKVNANPFTGGINLTTGETGQVGINFSVEWMNGGRTPAVNVALAGNFRIVAPPYPSEPPRIDFGDSRALAPGRTTIVPNIPFTGPAQSMLQRDLDRLRKRQCRAFLYARADYNDVFSEIPRYFELCVEVIYDGIISGTDMINWRFTVSGPQNGAG